MQAQLLQRDGWPRRFHVVPDAALAVSESSLETASKEDTQDVPRAAMCVGFLQGRRPRDTPLQTFSSECVLNADYCSTTSFL